MQFEPNTTLETWGYRTGFTFSYLVFTTILFFVLTWLDKLPEAWTYFHVMGLTVLIVLLGLGIQRMLR